MNTNGTRVGVIEIQNHGTQSDRMKKKNFIQGIFQIAFNEFIILNQFEYFKDAPDGTFWMSWSDFLVEFESLSVCMLPNSE